MIRVENGGHYDSCNCCHSKEDVKQIKFMSEYSGIIVVLCRNCRNELFQKLQEENNEETV